MTLPSITCPVCHKTSYNLGDVQHRYCGFCHQFHDNMGVGRFLDEPVITHTEQDCDETCHYCARCHQASGIEVCNKLCQHAKENYPDGWPIP